MSTVETLERLNQEYIDAFMNSDVAWYEAHLADDFMCIEADGVVLDKPAFLVQTAAGPGVTDYHLEVVSVRPYGPIALVRATGRFARPDGSIGGSHYVDVYAEQDGAWKVVSAQVTRAAAP